MPRRQTGSRVVALASIAGLWVGVGCQSALLPASGGRWVHPQLGYTVDAPAVSPLVWEALAIDGADLAYRHRDGSSLALMSECARGPAPPSLLARQLLIGIGERELIASHPIELGPDSGWKLVFRTLEEEREFTVRAVTLAAGSCTFDWLWVATGRPAEAVWFDQWWESFQREGGDR
ncbi:MAG: hypothetical protein VX681_02210 [Myxococcota bacterium]|nr:hypothetical protein [Myxococcota bacterium]